MITYLRRRLEQLGFASILALAIVMIGASPVSADPARPTNYESVITSIAPAISGLAAEVVGGDSFFRLRVTEAREVIVLGYESEPYLRFGVDGTVEENTKSPAVVLNESRYGSEVDTQADAKAPPDWRVVGNDGVFLWHDHRIHWMVQSDPPQLRGEKTGKVLDWNIPLLVDGQSVQINGALFRVAAPSTVPYLALGVVAAGAAGLAMWRARKAAAGILLVVSGFAFVVSLVDQLSIPSAAGRRISFYVIPAIAAICALASIIRPRSAYAFVLRIATALILPMWVYLNAGALTNARLPGEVAPALVRVAVVAAAAAVVAFIAIELPRGLRAAAARNAAIIREARLDD